MSTKICTQSVNHVIQKLKKLDIAVEEECRRQGKEPCKCPTCSRLFMDAQKVQTHHCGLQPKWQCSVCPDSFSSEASLADHLRRHEEALEKCSHCPRGFSTLRGLMKHIKITHPTAVPPTPTAIHPKPRKHHPYDGPPSLACSICSVSFQREAQLATHLIKHADEVEECPVCPKGFKTLTGLQSHVGIAHSRTETQGIVYFVTVEPESSSSAAITESAKRRKRFVECQSCHQIMHRTSSLQHLRSQHNKRPFPGGSSNDCTDRLSPI